MSYDPKQTMTLLKQPSSSLPLCPKSSIAHRAFSQPLIADVIEEAEALILRWIPPQISGSSSPSCSLTSLFSPQNRGEGRRFIDVLTRLHYAMQSLDLMNQESAKLARVYDSMRVGIKHLKKEFYRILKSNRRYLDPESVSLWSSGTGTTVSDSRLSKERGGEDSDVIVDLKMIANFMISSGYEKDCAKIYTKIRKKILADALCQLGFAQTKKFELEFLENNIQKWIRVARTAIMNLFHGERLLCDHIFSSSLSMAESVFAKITLKSAMNLFVFPISVAKCKKTAEKIFPTLDVYQTISHLLPKIEQIFSYNSTVSVRSQAVGSLHKLGETVNSMLTDLESSITKESSKSPITGGGVHQLTRYVMNFIVFLADYSDSLATILKESSIPLPENYFDDEKSTSGSSPMAKKLAWLILVLLCKIDTKSRLYNDMALSYLFLANNLHYVLIKVRTSNLISILGDNWVSNHEVKVSQYVDKYVKVAWGEVIRSLPGDSMAEAEAEESLRRFNEAFEEAYKNHNTWIVPEPKLRDEIKVSVDKKIVSGYTLFCKNYQVPSCEIIRFTPEDLTNYISVLFSGARGKYRF